MRVSYALGAQLGKLGAQLGKIQRHLVFCADKRLVGPDVSPRRMSRGCHVAMEFRILGFPFPQKVGKARASLLLYERAKLTFAHQTIPRESQDREM